MDRTTISALTRKDITTVLRNRGVRIPLLTTPVLLLVLVPVALVGGLEILTRTIGDLGASATSMAGAVEAAQSTAGSSTGVAVERWASFVLEVFLAPLYLLVPLLVASVIAADAFAGERERGTLEALLHTPTTDRDLLIAKFLAAWLPAVAVSTVGFLVYSLVANALAWPYTGALSFPTPVWVLLAAYVAPGLAALGLGVMVVVSARVNSVQAAHQIGSLVVLPMIVLLIAQVTGATLLQLGSVAVLGTGIWLMAVLTIAIGARTLRRDRLALRL